MPSNLTAATGISVLCPIGTLLLLGLSPLLPMRSLCSFTGSRGSIRGDINFYGKQAINFFTQTKTITSNWKYTGESTKLSMSMPTLG